MKKYYMSEFVSHILDFIFPPRCPLCNEIIIPKGREACPACLPNLSYVDEPFCLKCGKPLDEVGMALCNDCRNTHHLFRQSRSPFVYNDAMRISIYRFKYNGRREYAAFYGEQIVRKLGDYITGIHADAIIPVPLYKDKERKRGFNQAYLLAKEISKRTGIPCYEHFVVRIRNTKVMKDLSGSERQNNLKKAFITKENSVKLKRIIVVDDIYTTGSTMDAVAEALISSGVQDVYGITLCIGKM